MKTTNTLQAQGAAVTITTRHAGTYNHWTAGSENGQCLSAHTRKHDAYKGLCHNAGSPQPKRSHRDNHTCHAQAVFMGQQQRWTYISIMPMLSFVASCSRPPNAMVGAMIATYM